MTHEVTVLDISHHNIVESFDDIKAAGCVGVILKATEGSSYEDPTYWDRWQAATKAGLAASSYHFMRPGNYNEQMDHFVRFTDPIPGERLVLDHEDSEVSLEDLAYCVLYLREKRPDVEISIYSGHLLKDQWAAASDTEIYKVQDILASTSLWLAQYTSDEPEWVTDVWEYWTLWQYTDQGYYPGMEGFVDLNVFNGTEQGCLDWFNAPAREPEEELPVVRIEITIPEGVKVKVFVNEEKL